MIIPAPRAALAAMLAAALLAGGSAAAQARAHPPAAAHAARFTLTGADVRAGGRIPAIHEANGFGCTGRNVSPALSWSGAPAGTKSFAVTVHDLDAPTGSGWWHWTVYDIPATVTSLPAGAGNGNAAAPGRQGPTDFGKPGYGGPCPPVGGRAHRYVFTVYALKVPSIDLPAGATPAYLGFNLHANALATASFTALYSR